MFHFDEPTVRQLMISWQETRDEATFRALVQATDPLLCTLVRHAFGHHDEDARQKLLIKLWRVLPRYNGQLGCSGGYLRKVWGRYLIDCLPGVSARREASYVIPASQAMIDSVPQELDGLAPEELTWSDRWNLLRRFPVQNRCDALVLIHWLRHYNLPCSGQLVREFNHEFSLIAIRSTRRRLCRFLEQTLEEYAQSTPIP